LGLQSLALLHQFGVRQHFAVLSHLFDHSFVVNLNGAVVLVDLDAEFSYGGEVVRLGDVALESVVLHGVQVVVLTDQTPLVLVLTELVAGPNLLEVGNDMVTAFHDHSELVSASLDESDDLVVAHLEDLLAVDGVDVVPLLQPSLLGGGVGLDPAQLDGEGLVLAAHDDEAPGLALGPLQGHTYHLFGHLEVVFL